MNISAVLKAASAVASLVLIGLTAALCKGAQVELVKRSPAAARSDGPGLAEVIREFEADWNNLNRFYDLPWSSLRMERLDKLVRGWKERLDSLPFEGLEQPGRVDFLLLRNQLELEQGRLELEHHRVSEMEQLLPFRQPVQQLQQARWQTKPLQGAEAAAVVSSIADQIKKLRKQVRKVGSDDETPKNEKKAKDEAADSGKKIYITASLARRAATATDDVRRILRDWFGFYDGFVPEFGWWLRKPQSDAQTALEGYAKFLREEVAGLKGEDSDPLVGDPIGEEALQADIRAEWLPYSAPELVKIGEREYAWCLERMKEAAKEMGLGDDWKAALNRVKSEYVAPGKQDSVVAEKARHAIEFVRSKDLVTIPALAEEVWRLSMLTPEAQKNLPFAAYSGPNMMVAYARDDMKHEDKMMSMRGNNPHFMHIVTPHELIPGHHLQHFMAERHRPYRQSFSTPFLVEGWAVAWEFILWDRGYGTTPEDRAGMLFWRMHRAARIIVSLKFHLGQMTPAEMVDYLVERVGHERLGATSEVRRFIGGGYSPLYQCGYMIGALQLRALREEIVGAGKMTDREFSDAVLMEGPIPIELIRAALLNLPLTEKSTASWRFADRP